MTHIIADDGFGHMVHHHPFTGEPWTTETAADWRRRCAGRGRSGGVLIQVEECDCDDGKGGSS